MGSGIPCPELGGGPLVAGSWNQVGRTDLIPVTLPESVNHPCRDEYDNVLDIPCHMEILVLEVRCDASDLSINDPDV